MEERKCQHCGKILVRRIDPKNLKSQERPHEFAARKFCSRRCTAAGTGRNPRPNKIEKPFKMMSRTKWDTRIGLKRELLDAWYCQICGEENIKELPCWMHSMGNSEYLRICTQCYFNSKYHQTIEEIKYYTKTANLMPDVSQYLYANQTSTCATLPRSP